ncbi:SRPBCC family protein [Nocardia abscessus]|uniref:SRPBCC family protein n=1 Tax=Nocardia TaxID=1817 RepID=UPI00189477B3|nr:MULTISPECIES: SRPBCC family protein [Nocardia]MBF6217113.1 SRPBCC family protein [Nocardia abscessus]MDE1670659.1 SRPBCC family protein [Nocardia gipuzkoensis]
MVHVEITVPTTPDEVFAVLADGWLFCAWVVGATHIRDVDDNWPAVGSKLHYSAGVWPITANDTTQVVAVNPPHVLELEAKLSPLGAAWIRLELVETAPEETQIRMYEHAERGLGILVPNVLQELLLVPRNKESLSRLADIAVGRARHKSGTAVRAGAEPHAEVKLNGHLPPG